MAIPNIYQIISCSSDLVQSGRNVDLWGRVIAVFPFCIYVKSTTGKIVCIVDKALDNGPGRVRMDFLTPHRLRVEDGDRVTSRGKDVYLGDSAIARNNQATIWSPPSINSLGVRDGILGTMRWLLKQLEKDIPTGGLSSVLISTEDIATGSAPNQHGCDTVVSLGIPAIRDLALGWSAADRYTISKGVAQLIGLGPGLTPSGDDLLSGVLVALKQIQKIDPKFVGNLATEMLASEVARYAPGGTNVISGAMLFHAIKGNSICSVHCLLMDLFNSTSSIRTTKFAKDVVAIGHTSGWDTLAGLFLGLHLWLHKVGIATTSVLPSKLFKDASSWSRRVVESQ